MNRIIEITKCQDCPYFNNTGSFTTGGAKPCCNHPEAVKKKGNDCFKRVIPYKTNWDGFKENYPGQKPPREPKNIPNWCPLETAEDFAESNFKI